MFLQLIKPPATSTTPAADALQYTDSLFLYTPLQIAALVETVWRNRYHPMGSPFTAWPYSITNAILTDQSFFSGYGTPAQPHMPPTAGIPQWTTLPSGRPFVFPYQLPELSLAPGGTVRATNWDHLIYAYLIENTRIFDIFERLLETYAFSEDLETPSPAGQLFWRNTEYLIYGDGIPSLLPTTASRARRDEIANRQTVYNWMFGIDLSHAAELAKEHPYRKPAAANRDFIPTFEEFGREVWAGIMNAKNLSGPNPTDAVAIATSVRRLYDMMATRRLNGNLSREEFRAVALMSWLHLAVMYDSPIVVDLKATASSPEQRLAKLGDRVGIKPHSKAKPLFDLAQPFSYLMQAIETGKFNNSNNAALFYKVVGNNVLEANAEVVIDQYSLATGRDLKASSVNQRQQPGLPRSPVPARPALAAHASGHSNGHAHPTNGHPSGHGQPNARPTALTR
jgi:hypothetical protein